MSTLLTRVVTLGLVTLVAGLAACASSSDEGNVNGGDDVSGEDELKVAKCGGIAGIQCKTGYECIVTSKVKDAMGTCKPKTTPCGPNQCTGADVCCNHTCGICTPPGGFCTQQVCFGPPPPLPNNCGGCASNETCQHCKSNVWTCMKNGQQC